MADNDRYRPDRDRYRDRDDRDRGRDRSEYGFGRGEWRSSDDYARSADYGRHEDDGMIARRGFGNESAGYDRERDFGDSAGYGSGGSARDWRDVMGADRRMRGRASDGTGYARSRERGYGGSFGAGPSYGRGDDGRYGSSDFGRGSREEYEDRNFLQRAGDEIRSWFGDDEAERRRERDFRGGEYGAPDYRGRGPKGYQRSDERIREDVNDRLTDDPHVDASDIEISVSGREVTLSGTVNSRFEKRRAEDIAEAVSGVANVQNNLHLRQALGAGVSGNSGTTQATATTGASRRRTTSTSDT
jgi:osmotically-inducible protein OsmY